MSASIWTNDAVGTTQGTSQAQLGEFEEEVSRQLVRVASSHAPSYFRSRDESSALAAAVRSKLEDGNIKAAVRILCSDDIPAPNNQTTMDALRRRHPAAPADRCNLPNPSSCPALQTTELDVIKAIRSFPAGSSAGPDGLRPQYLLDLISCQEAGHALVMAITALVNL
jgi:hypothetical protein